MIVRLLESETEPNRVGNRFVDRSNNRISTRKPSGEYFRRLEYGVFPVLEQWPVDLISRTLDQIPRMPAVIPEVT